MIIDRDEKGRMRLFGWFVPAHLFSAPFNPEMYVKILAFALCLGVVVLVFSGVIALKERIFPSRKPATSSTATGDVNAGGTVNITNVNNPSQRLKVGLYVGLSSDRATVGVFREVTSNIDLEIGGGKSYEGKAIAEVRARLKF